MFDDLKADDHSDIAETQPTHGTMAKKKSLLEEFYLPGETPTPVQTPKVDPFQNLLDKIKLNPSPASDLPRWMKETKDEPIKDGRNVPEWLEEDDQHEESGYVPDWLKGVNNANPKYDVDENARTQKIDKNKVPLYKHIVFFVGLAVLLYLYWFFGQVSVGIPDEYLATIFTVLLYNWFVKNDYQLPKWLKK